ncbi:MAG: glycosyltransferase [Candidatus Bathyarchaeia archaeon]
MYDVALVLGRHIHEPFLEGGGKITYLVAKALSEIGIQTYLIKVNYSLPEEGFYIIKTKAILSDKLSELELRTGLLSQNDVLHKIHGIVGSNLIELVASPLAVAKLVKKMEVMNNNKNIYVFIGNSSKLGGFLINNFFRFLSKNSVKILAIYRREEIFKYTTRILKPKLIFTTSNELLIITNKILNNIIEKIKSSYPPILPSEFPTQLYARKLPIILYMGRISNQRFPLNTLKQIIINLKKTSKDASLMIVSPPESVSLNWLKTAKELVSKLDARNRVIFIFKTLENREKQKILTNASVFIFPAKSVVAVEPPLSVLESLVYGLYLITTGGNSTKELVNSGAGHIVRNFEKIDFDEYLTLSYKLSYKISEWAKETFMFTKLVNSLKDLLNIN